MMVIDIQDFLWDSDNGTLHLELFFVLILYVIQCLFFFFKWDDGHSLISSSNTVYCVTSHLQQLCIDSVLYYFHV